MKREIQLGHTLVTDESDCYVIAEIGHNHMGKLEVCKEMIRVAKDCGADAVKLQKRDNKTFFTKELYNQIYDNPNSYGRTYGEHREALEFDRAQHIELQEYSRQLDITFFSTAFDITSADFLQDLDMPLFKIASGDLKHIPLLRHVAHFGKPVILSTGGGTMDDVRRAVDTIAAINPQLAILQCTAAYPCEYDELNLRVITKLRDEFPQFVIGLSDHEKGISMSVVAYVLGARIIEKHFTLARTNKGTDHAFSLEPLGLSRTVRDLKRTRVALGDGNKGLVESEKRPLVKMAKALYSASSLPAGTILTADHIAFRCPGTIGLSPDYFDRLLGARLKRDLQEEELLLLEDLELRR